MAVDLGVWLASAKLPSFARWERAARELGFRLRVKRVDLQAHRGVLPIAFNHDELNSGFEFQIRSDWRLAPRTVVPGDRDVQAWFKCFNAEYAETVWSAVAFAKACDGLFIDECGAPFATIEDAVAYAHDYTPLAEPGAAADGGHDSFLSTTAFRCPAAAEFGRSAAGAIGTAGYR